MAAALLVHHLSEAGVAALVASAGLLEGGRPAAPEAVAVLAARGIDLGELRSRRLEVGLVRDADLVLGMERRHIRAAAALDPTAPGRSFTVKQLLRRALRTPREPVRQPLVDWLGTLDDAPPEERAAGDVAADDVADPLGGGPAAFEACATELDLLVRGLCQLVWEGGR